MPSTGNSYNQMITGLNSLRDSLLQAEQIKQKDKALELQEQNMNIQAEIGQQRIDTENRGQKLEVFRALVSAGAMGKADAAMIGKELETELLGQIDGNINLKPAQQQTLSLSERLELISAKGAEERKIISAQQEKDLTVLSATEEGKSSRQEKNLSDKEQGRVANASIQMLREGATLEQVMEAQQQGTLVGKGKVPTKTGSEVIGRGEKKGFIFTDTVEIPFSEVAETFGVNQDGNLIADEPIEALNGRSMAQALSQYSDFVNRTPRPDVAILQKARDALLAIDPRAEEFLDKIEGKK